jgi:hypothetical protein
MEAVRTSETSVYSNETTRRYIPEDSNLHTRHRKDLKSHIFVYSLFNDALSVSNTIQRRMKDYEYMINSKGCGRKWSWPN